MRDDKGRFVNGVRASPETEFKPGEHWRDEKPHWREEWLRDRYEVDEMSAAEIAEEAGCTENNILYWMDKHGIKRRTISEAREVKSWSASGEANGMYGRTGADNPRYVDGSSPLRQRMYARGRGKAFLRKVLKRDDYTCQRCGSGNDLHVHHIKPWAGNPGHRFDEGNVVTLCKDCHSWVHSNDNQAGEYLDA